MKYIDNRLYIEFAELVQVGVSENTIKSATLRNSWSCLNDPADKRRVLFEYEKLKDTYKEKLRSVFGDPYEYMAKQPIRNMIRWDSEAESFFLDYRYEETKTLPLTHVEKYTKAASVLNMLRDINTDKKALKKLLNKSIEEFYEHVIDIIKVDRIDLPTSYRRLLAKRSEYEEKGYASLIDWRFGLRLAAKVKDELSESMLLEMIAHPNQYDDVFIAQQYNKWAVEAKYKEIDASTVGVYRRKQAATITMQREGNAALKAKFLKQAKGFRPTTPFMLFESDDNHIDLLFEDPNNPIATRRYTAIVVIDSYNDYVLGYAYALNGSLKEGQTIDLVKAAYVNAMYYIRSLTGKWILPQEVKTDRWALAALRPFYQGMANYFDTPVGSKNRGYIENFFGTPHWKRCLKAGAVNYTGNNITAKNRGVNMEVLAGNKKQRPQIGNEAANQIENFFHRLRHMPTSKKISKHDEWISAYNAMDETQFKVISDEQYLLKFGLCHNPKGDGIRITNRGVEPQINGVKYSFDLETDHLIDLIGARVSIYYDPYDMNRVLVTDHANIRVIGRDARLNSRALSDATTNSRTYLNSVLTERRDDVKLIANKAEKRKAVLREYRTDAETVLQAGIMVKEIKTDGEAQAMNFLLSAESVNFLESDEDFDVTRDVYKQY